MERLYQKLENKENDLFKENNYLNEQIRILTKRIIDRDNEILELKIILI